MADIKTLVEEAKQQFHACIGFALNDDDTLHSAGPHAIAALDALAEAHQAEVARLTRENEGLHAENDRLQSAFVDVNLANEGLAKDAARYRALKYAPTELIRDLIVAAPGRWDEMADAVGAQEGERT